MCRVYLPAPVGGGQFYRLNYDGQVAVAAQAEDYALWIKALLDVHQMVVSLFGGRGRMGGWRWRRRFRGRLRQAMPVRWGLLCYG